MDDRAGDSGRWTLLTGHGHVLVEIARRPQARVRDIAATCGITQRAAQGIIADLEATGYLTRARAGRRTVYTVHLDRPFRHPAQAGLQVGPFLQLLAAADDDRTLATALAGVRAQEPGQAQTGTRRSRAAHGR